MIPKPHLRNWLTGLARQFWRDNEAAQLVEFAVSLPLLVVFVVGIFDFSGAYTLKQKLTNIARDSARAAAADPATDLTQPASIPASVSDALQLVRNYLAANQLSDCGITQALYTLGPGLKWTFTVTPTSSAPCGIILTINRAYYFPVGAASQPANVNCQPQGPPGVQVQVISTCVSIQYAYQWRFGRVASLLGATTALPSNISATAVAMNEN